MQIERLADRILWRKGDVIMKSYDSIVDVDKVDGKMESDIQKVLQIDEEMESKTVDLYNDFASKWGAAGDSNSKRLFEKLIEIEEQHEDTFDIEGDNFKKFGDTYLALQTIQRVQGNDEDGHEDIGTHD